MIARLRDPRLLAALVGLAVLFAAAAVVPYPSIDQIRAWSESVGPIFPLIFFLVHVVVTVAPVPRTLFTISAGVLFGAATGLLVTIAATTISAILALLLVRAIGRDTVAAHLTHPAVRAVDMRLERRGWLAVGSLRLIAPIPFSVINYCCGVSSIRTLPYTAATIVGIVPGTVGVVLLGDALTGEANPAMLLLSGICIAVGVAGLILDARTPVIPPADSVQS
ncbi:TVP38/TMEM64 family protein [Prescottella defluvii]|uniref:TVP38/TMEM64 family protein n=1 Tax=Prescottella defluvii TaxID=1323361 RepID=UPI0004F3B025|nr:TVP38/TMEM64 family protein [Prescottella defluvii]